LAVSGVAIAIALGILIAVLTSGEGEQVVVVSGERAGERAQAAPRASADTSASAEPAAAANAAPAAPEDGQTRALNQALQTQGTAFERCFVDHLDLDQTDQAPEVVLHFTIPPGGADANVAVEPKDIAKTPLGACLARVGDRVPFPALQRGVSFRVPVRARFAQAK